MRGRPTPPPVAGIIKAGKQLAARRIEALLAIEYPPCPNLGKVTGWMQQVGDQPPHRRANGGGQLADCQHLGGEPDTPGWRE